METIFKVSHDVIEHFFAKHKGEEEIDNSRSSFVGFATLGFLKALFSVANLPNNFPVEVPFC